MKSRTFLAFAFVVLGLGAAVPAQAQGAARMCAPTNAEKATVAAIAADPAAWMGKCVTLPAIYSNEQLYADQDAIYGVNRHVIGGFADGKGTIEGFWSGQFTGRVADCVAAEREQSLNLLRSPGISVNGRPMGCPEPTGPFLIFMSQRDLKPAPLKRRLAPAKGDLAPIPLTDDTVPPRRIKAFVEALRSGDRATLSRMSEASDFAVEQLFADDTAIADLRQPVERPMQAFKVAGPPDGAVVDGKVVAVVCSCRTKDCSKTWPIALRDADNQPSRPYACIRVRNYSRSWDVVSSTYDASQNFDGLPEPH